MYKKFLIMLGLSFIIMYSVMFMNAADASHIYININRFYMAVLMVSPMAIIMMAFMSSMYKNKKLNRIIMGVSTLTFFAAFFLLRSQTVVGDKQFIRSMIPHHSSAILVSEESQINDPQLKKLSQEIIRTQKEEIAEMENILERLDK